METLPDLPRVQILSYLRVADLLAFSSVSTKWRAAANCDRIWKIICSQTSNQTTINHLQDVNSTVEPLFDDYESENSNLECLCYWRVMYMKLMHVKRNWQRANHETFRVTGMAYNFFDIKIYNNFLVANVNDNQCEVWNIRGVPKKQETIACALKSARCKCMIHLCNNKLVIVQDTLLQVYLKTEKNFSLCFRRLFNQSEAASADIPGSLTIDDWYNKQVQRRPTHLQAFYVGKYFIGVAQNGSYENASFHVWDTSFGSKLREESIKQISPDVIDPVYNVKFCPPKSDLGKILICVHHSKRPHLPTGHDNYRTMVYLYDLQTFEFKKLRVLKPHVPWIYYEGSFFISLGNDQAKLSIFNSSNGAKVISKRYEEIINPDSVQVHGEYLGFTTGGDLVVLSISDFDLVFTTAIIKFSSNLFGFDFIFIDWGLVLIACWDGTNKIEVWSIKDKCLQSTLKAGGLVFPCNNKSKVCVWNEMVTSIYILQFW